MVCYALLLLGAINTLLQEIALKLRWEDDTPADKDWYKYKTQIYLKLQRMFKEADINKIDEMMKIFRKKQAAKDEMNQLSDMLFRFIEFNLKNFKNFVKEKNISEEEADKLILGEWINGQARDILGSIHEQIELYINWMNKYKVYKIYAGIKRIKSDDPISDKLTGDLETDAKMYIAQHKTKTLKGVFLKEKITSNTVLKKIKDIILLFDEKHHPKLLSDLEEILHLKIGIYQRCLFIVA